MDKEELRALEAILGHTFSNPQLLERALTHSSHAHEELKAELKTESKAESKTEFKAGRVEPASTERIDNEQLEFLGDAVLGLVASQLLFERFSGFHEGQLSKLKAHLVSAEYLVTAATELDLGRYLRLGRGEERSGGRGKSALLSDAMEAVMAAMYLDCGLEKTRQFIIQRILQPELDRIGAETENDFSLADYKSALQELLQSSGRLQPVYATVKEEGPDHRKTFTVEARIYPQGQQRPEYVTRAEGATKKKAEQLAAKQALEHLRHQPDSRESRNP